MHLEFEIRQLSLYANFVGFVVTKSDIEQFYVATPEAAGPVLERLRSDQEVTDLRVVPYHTTATSGVWVAMRPRHEPNITDAAVAQGSPAYPAQQTSKLTNRPVRRHPARPYNHRSDPRAA